MRDMNKALSDLLAYAKIHLGMKEEDGVYLSNCLIERLGLDSFEPCPADEAEIAALEAELALPNVASDYKKAGELAHAVEEKRAALELRYAEWETAQTRLEEMEKNAQ